MQFNMYGTIQRITIPIFLDEVDIEQAKDVTEEFKKQIASLQKR
jgi:uncharacterized protein YlaN (UPF0358 family)